MYLKEVQRMCQDSFKEESKECLKEVSMVFQEIFKGVSRNIEGCLRKISVFERSSKGSFKCAH